MDKGQGQSTGINKPRSQYQAPLNSSYLKIATAMKHCYRLLKGAQTVSIY